ncbi:MAG: holo-ACP synthase [Spirochaetia bacterium]|nr:holo-ACP synthase [Spirochaetota bacterium]MCX8095997.1 holo-ACP synthase [Spirochaetota bacterium]MDW8112514.1 holo-ACP synthase [Spirochaetia bacterium]
MIRLGVDVSDISRVKEFYERKGEKFIDRILTPKEKEYVMKHEKFLLNLAGRFAGKEAFFKALGTGIINFKEVEILNEQSGRPYINLYGKTKEIFDSLKAKNIEISISHTELVAVSVVVIEI